MLSNPPFGKDWEADENAVKEQAKVHGSRFSHGLPSTSDGQMLFWPIAHRSSARRRRTVRADEPQLSRTSRRCSTATTGPNSIRQWLLEEDLIDAVVALPTSMFYGTGIATYVWILDTNKDPERKGKIQLIDGSGQWDSLRKPMGDKRREMGKNHRETLMEAYKAFDQADPAISRVMTPEDFMFRDVPVYKAGALRDALQRRSCRVAAQPPRLRRDACGRSALS